MRFETHLCVLLARLTAKQAPQSNTVDCGAKPVTAKKLSAMARLTSAVQAGSLAERYFFAKRRNSGAGD